MAVLFLIFFGSDLSKMDQTWSNWISHQSKNVTVKSSRIYEKDKKGSNLKVLTLFSPFHVVSFFNSKFYVDFSFFRFWSLQVWGLIRCTTHWSIGCIPWMISLENGVVSFSYTGRLWELWLYNFNLFSLPSFATFAF